MKTIANASLRIRSLCFIGCSSLLGILLTVCLCATMASADEIFEVPPIFRASELLPGESIFGKFQEYSRKVAFTTRRKEDDIFE